ncbi:MAG: hypothetical protein ACFCUQ_17100 [Kiloniellales bacterium]
MSKLHIPARTLAALTLLATLSATAAHDTAAQNYNGEPSEDISTRVQGLLVEAAFPSSKALAYVLATLPGVDGGRLPLSVRIDVPPDPNEPVSIVHSCVFGPQICEPFFTACERLGGETSETTCELPRFDPPPPPPPPGN